MSNGPVGGKQAINRLKIRIACHEGSAERQRRCGNPKIVFSQRQSFLLAGDFHRRVMIAGIFGNRFARDFRKQQVRNRS